MGRLLMAYLGLRFTIYKRMLTDSLILSGPELDSS